MFFLQKYSHLLQGFVNTLKIVEYLGSAFKMTTNKIHDENIPTIRFLN